MLMPSDAYGWTSDLVLAWDGNTGLVLYYRGDARPTDQAGLASARPRQLALFTNADAKAWTAGTLLDCFRPYWQGEWLRAVTLPADCDSVLLVNTDVVPPDVIVQIRLLAEEEEEEDALRAPFRHILCLTRRHAAAADTEPDLHVTEVEPQFSLPDLEPWLNAEGRMPIWVATSDFGPVAGRDLAVASTRRLLPPETSAVRIESPVLNPPQPRVTVPDGAPSVRRILPGSVDDTPHRLPRVTLLIRVPRDADDGQAGSGVVVAQIFDQRRLYAEQSRSEDPSEALLALKPLDHAEVAMWRAPPRLTPPGDLVVDSANLRWRAAHPEGESIQVELLPADSTGGMESTYDNYFVSFRGIGRGDVVVVLNSNGAKLRLADGTEERDYLAWLIDGHRLIPQTLDLNNEALKRGLRAPGHPMQALWERGPEIAPELRPGPLTAWLHGCGYPPAALQGVADPLAALRPLYLLAYNALWRRLLKQGHPAARLPSFVRYAGDPAMHDLLCERPDVTRVLQDPQVRPTEARVGHLAYRVAMAVGRPHLMVPELDVARQLFLLGLLQETDVTRLDLAARAQVRFDAGDWSPDQLTPDALRTLADIIENGDDYIADLEDAQLPEPAAKVRAYKDARHRGEWVAASDAVLVIAARLRALELAAADEKLLNSIDSLEAPRDESAAPSAAGGGTLEDLRVVIEQATAIDSPELKPLIAACRHKLQSGPVSRRFIRGAIRRLQEKMGAPGAMRNFELVADALEAWAGLSNLSRDPDLAGEAAYRARRERMFRLVGRAPLPRSAESDATLLKQLHRRLGNWIRSMFSKLPQPEPALVTLLTDYAHVLLYHKAYVLMGQRLLAFIDGPATFNPGSPAWPLFRRLHLWPDQASATLGSFETWIRQTTGESVLQDLTWGVGTAPAADAILSLKVLASEIDWSNAETLSQGDTRTLPVRVVPLISAASDLAEVRALGLALNIDPVQVVIALLANLAAVNDRNAGHVFHAVLGRAEPAMVEAALRAMTL